MDGPLGYYHLSILQHNYLTPEIYFRCSHFFKKIPKKQNAGFKDIHVLILKLLSNYP